MTQAWAQFRADWAMLPHGAFKRWAWTVLIGLFLCCGLVAGSSMVGPGIAERGMQEWDRRVLLWIERGPVTLQSAILLESPGNFLYMIPVTVAAAVLAARAGRSILTVTILTGYLLARPIFLLGFTLWDRPRPRLILEGLAAPPFDSFPSGHVVQATAVYGLLAYAWASRSGSVIERAVIVILLILWISVVGIARIRLGAHWPSDVIAGAVFGAAWLLVLVHALRAAERRPGRDVLVS
jgi:undecaprenyl-diphosphatase